MSSNRIGELFSGYGGLGLGVQAALGGRVVWHSDIDKGACKILAHRYPDVPNLGDITVIDWPSVPAIDILTAGFPCQDVSGAGRQAGLRRGTRTGLWHHVVEAIRHLRPSVVLLENVLGLLSALGDEPSHDLLAAEASIVTCNNLLIWLDLRRTRAHREGRTEDAQRHLDRRVRVLGLRGRAVARARDARAAIARALATVLGSLASLGFDAEWVCVNASDVGAPHRRTRVFILAWPANAASDARRILDRDGLAAADAECGGLDRGAPHQVGGAVERATAAWGGEGARLFPTPSLSDFGRGGADPESRVGHTVNLVDAVHGLLPTPMSRDFKGTGPADGDRRSPNLSAVGALLPTPAVNDMGEGKTVEAWDGWTAEMQARHGNGNGHGKSLAIEAQRLLPTPRAGDGEKGGPNQRGSSGDLMLPSAAIRRSAWGKYAEAVDRWRDVTRPAPAPTEVGPKGSPRLSARFSEWMMGVAAGWITDVPDLTRNEALKACGNGVVPQQACAAVVHLADRMVRSMASAA